MREEILEPQVWRVLRADLAGSGTMGGWDSLVLTVRGGREEREDPVWVEVSALQVPSVCRDCLAGRGREETGAGTDFLGSQA